MSTKTTTSEYIVICRGAGLDESLSPEGIHNAMEQFYAWFERMSDEGKMKSGHQLAPGGKVLSQKGINGRSVSRIQGSDRRVLDHSGRKS